MKKREFLDLLKFYLKDMPNIMIDDIISDYEEHFQIAIENGKTEEQICNELGSPELIAKDYINNEKGRFRPSINENKDSNTQQRKNKKEKSNTSIGIIILCIIGALFLIPPVFGIGVALIATIFAFIVAIIALVISIIISIFAAGFSLVVLGISIPMYGIFSFISIPNIFLLLHPVTRFFLSVASISLGILIIYFGFMVIYGVFKLIKKIFIAITWKINKRRQAKW